MQLNPLAAAMSGGLDQVYVSRARACCAQYLSVRDSAASAPIVRAGVSERLCRGIAFASGRCLIFVGWLQSNLHYTATWAGIVTAPSGITALLVAPFVGKYISRYDPRMFATVSFLIFSASYFMRAQFPPDASFWVFAMPALVQGFAMGIFFVALLSIALDRIPPEKIPAASGLNNFLRIVASGFATSLTTTYWDRREAFHQSRLVESLSVFDPALRALTTSIKGLGVADPSAAASVLH
jgi:DHA2 family multidrug resistance protein